MWDGEGLPQGEVLATREICEPGSVPVPCQPLQQPVGSGEASWLKGSRGSGSWGYEPGPGEPGVTEVRPGQPWSKTVEGQVHGHCGALGRRAEP